MSQTNVPTHFFLPYLHMSIRPCYKGCPHRRTPPHAVVSMPTVRRKTHKHQTNNRHTRNERSSFRFHTSANTKYSISSPNTSSRAIREERMSTPHPVNQKTPPLPMAVKILLSRLQKKVRDQEKRYTKSKKQKNKKQRRSQSRYL
jgi:hypothetical protein